MSRPSDPLPYLSHAGEPDAARVPGDSTLRPSRLAWVTGEEEHECDCLWSWGDGPECIGGSPILFLPPPPPCRP